MPFTLTPAPSSRISKPKAKKPSFDRSITSPIHGLKQRKSVSDARSKPDTDDDDDIFNERLDDVGLVACLIADKSLRDVAQSIIYTNNNMFDEIPERAGIHSVRIAEILNFRKSLPRIVTSSHVHAFMKSPTIVEKEVAELMAAGVIRKVVIPGRGVGGSSVSDALVLVQDWQMAVENSGVGTEATEKYVKHLKNNPLASTISQSVFSTAEIVELMQAGFLTSNSRLMNSANVFTRPDSTASTTLTSLASISRAASGSMAAVGGSGAVHGAGGSGSGALQRGNSDRSLSKPDEASNAFVKSGQEFQLALPSTGSYLRLLTAARSHLVLLLSKSKYREAPEYLLRERWDGAVANDGSRSNSLRARNEFSAVLPGRTRKWKHFHGLKFDWVLAECVGAGLIEVFETGSVGRGVRAI